MRLFTQVSLVTWLPKHCTCPQASVSAIWRAWVVDWSCGAPKWFVVAESSSTLELLFAQVTRVHHLGAPVPAGYMIVTPDCPGHHSSFIIVNTIFGDNIILNRYFFSVFYLYTVFWSLSRATQVWPNPPLKASRHTVWYKGTRSHPIYPHTRTEWKRTISLQYYW